MSYKQALHLLKYLVFDLFSVHYIELYTAFCCFSLTYIFFLEITVNNFIIYHITDINIYFEVFIEWLIGLNEHI